MIRHDAAGSLTGWNDVTMRHVTMLLKIVQDGATRHDVGEDRTGWKLHVTMLLFGGWSDVRLMFCGGTEWRTYTASCHSRPGSSFFEV